MKSKARLPQAENSGDIFRGGASADFGYYTQMKNTIRSAAASFLCIAASMAFGATPAMNVTVSDASGKAAFKGRTNANGVFATAKLTPGNYTVQLASQSPEVKGKSYSIVIAAGKKKVSSGAVPGEKFARGGVALKVDVGAGLNITGQVATEERVSKGGKKMVWIPPMVGSNMPGRWVEEDSAEAASSKARGSMSKDAVNKMQESATNPQG